MSRKSQRETRHILAVSEQLSRIIDEEVELGFKERPFLEDPSKPPVICYLPEERRQIEIRKGEIQNELGKLMEDYGWTKNA